MANANRELKAGIEKHETEEHVTRFEGVRRNRQDAARENLRRIIEEGQEVMKEPAFRLTFYERFFSR
jgi:ferritin-like metal-binding protein YciE